MAVSSLMRVQRLRAEIQPMPAKPERNAPSNMAGKLRSPTSRNARHNPGNAAWANASPVKLRRRRTAKLPTSPALAPSRLVPTNTISVL